MEAEEFFYGFSNHFMDLGLDNLKAFMNKLGNPQNQVKVIHVAGTNGKGSASSFLTSILMEAGYRVGKYNSPVVFEKWENLTVNDKKISEEEFSALVEEMHPVMEEADSQGRLPTVFELETALAYLYFAKMKCDFAVVECGMGGRLDATNITESSVLEIFVSISMDHTVYLGDTLKKIAEEKAGIIKPDTQILMIEQKEEVNQTICDMANRKHAHLHVIDRSHIKCIQADLRGQKFSYLGENQEEEIYEISMPGIFQAENAALAVEAARLLGELGYPVDRQAVKAGLKKMRLPGRFETVWAKEPAIILDGAHNPGAALRLKENLMTLLDGYHRIFVVGIFADKNYEKIVSTTCGLADEIYVVSTGGTRALSRETLVSCIESMGWEAQPEESVSAALEQAVQKGKELTAQDGKPSAVLCFGSLSWLKNVKEEIERWTKDAD